MDSRVRGQASWGATLALPLPPFAEQLGFNPSPAVGSRMSMIMRPRAGIWPVRAVASSASAASAGERLGSRGHRARLRVVHRSQIVDAVV